MLSMFFWTMVPILAYLILAVSVLRNKKIKLCVCVAKEIVNYLSCFAKENKQILCPFAKNDHREPCVTVCPSKNYHHHSCVVRPCVDSCPGFQKNDHHQTCVGNMCMRKVSFFNHHQRRPSSYMNVDLPHTCRILLRRSFWSGISRSW